MNDNNPTALECPQKTCLKTMGHNYYFPNQYFPNQHNLLFFDQQHNLLLFDQNLHIDKNRDAPPGGSSIIQYLFFIEINKHIELGYKNQEEEHTYTKIQNIIRRLIKSRIIWDEFEELIEEFDLMDIEGLQEGPKGN